MFAPKPLQPLMAQQSQHSSLMVSSAFLVASARRPHRSLQHLERLSSPIHLDGPFSAPQTVSRVDSIFLPVISSTRPYKDM